MLRRPFTLRGCWMAFQVRKNATYSAKHTAVRGEPIPETVASSVPALQSLAARLSVQDIPYSALARTLISETASLKYANNAGLSRFGKTLLSFFVHEHFMLKYPRLPPPVLRRVVETYTGMPALAAIGTMWGVEPDTRSAFSRYLADASDVASLGKLSFTDANIDVEKGVIEKAPVGKHAIDLNGAMGHFVRALVAAVYAHRGIEGAGEFIKSYIVKPQKLDILSIMSFSRPTRELSTLCAREGLEPPVSRLMAESGRYSIAPVFVVGVFSGAQKLGEGQGSSLREARTRAAVNALQGWYLYSPVGTDDGARFVDAGQVVI